MKEYLKAEEYKGAGEAKDGKERRTWIISRAFFFLIIPLLMLCGVVFFKDRSYYLLSLCIILSAMIGFLARLEQRRPQAREIVVIAVMTSIAVAGRTAFLMLPQIKPMVAILMITGIAMGAEAGFLAGTLAGFVSNFFLGQGPWTPWQMFSFGLMGFLAGLVFHRRYPGREPSKWAISLFGGAVTFLIYGGVMDTASLLMFTREVSWRALLGMYIGGLPFNLIHGASTMVFLFILEKPLIKKLNRIKKKYGLMED